MLLFHFWLLLRRLSLYELYVRNFYTNERDNQKSMINRYLYGMQTII